MAQIKIYQHEFRCPYCETVLQSGIGQINPMDIYPPSFNCRHCHNLIIVASEEAYNARKKYQEGLKERDKKFTQELKKRFLPIYLGAFLTLFVLAALTFSKLGSSRVHPLMWLIIFGGSLLFGAIPAYYFATRKANSRLKPYLDEKDKELTQLRKIMNSKS